MFLSKARARPVCKKKNIRFGWWVQCRQCSLNEVTKVTKQENNIPKASKDFPIEFRLHIYVLLLGQMVYIFVFISYFGFSDSWVLFRTELYMN